MFTWRRLYAEGALAAVGAGDEVVVPASEYRAFSIPTNRRAAAHRASSGKGLWKWRPKRRSALCIERTKAQRPQRRLGQAAAAEGVARSDSIDASAAAFHPASFLKGSPLPHQAQCGAPRCRSNTHLRASGQTGYGDGQAATVAFLPPGLSSI